MATYEVLHSALSSSPLDDFGTRSTTGSTNLFSVVDDNVVLLAGDNAPSEEILFVIDSRHLDVGFSFLPNTNRPIATAATTTSSITTMTTSKSTSLSRPLLASSAAALPLLTTIPRPKIPSSVSVKASDRSILVSPCISTVADGIVAAIGGFE